MNNTNMINQLLNSSSDNAYHLIDSVLRHNPLLIFQRLSASHSYHAAARLLQHVSINHHQQNHDGNTKLTENDILYIFIISALKLQSAPPEILGASQIATFINKSYNCWNDILSYSSKV